MGCNDASLALTKSSDGWAWLLQWRAKDRKTAYLCTLILVLCAFVLSLVVYGIWNNHNIQTAGGHRPSGDFFALWSYAKIASSYPAAELYDFGALHAREVALGMDPSAQKWFAYPPTALVLLWPLSLLPYGMAYLLWILTTLALFVWAVIGTCSRLPLCVISVIVAPVSAATIAYGQSGFLAAALITAGIRLAGSRPVISGLLIGILSYKPQLGLLVPISLVAAGYWSVLGVSCATAVGLGVIATLTFGWAIWPAWVAMLPAYAAMFDGRADLLNVMPTVLGNLKMAGFTSSAAQFVQALVTIAVAILVARCFRRHPARLAAAALLVGTLLATPHALIYDMPMIMAAMALFIEEHLEVRDTFSVVDVLALVLAMIFPLMMFFNYPSIPVSSMSLLLLFGVILRDDARFVMLRGLGHGSGSTSD